MRSLAAMTVLVSLVAGCGGGSDSSAISSANSALAVDRSLAVANGVSVVTATATIRDGNASPMPGVTVAFAGTGSGNAWVPASATTDARGIAAATVASTVAEAKTLSVAAGGVAITQVQAVTFAPRTVSPTVSTLAVAPATVIANGLSTATATATVRDADGVPMSGVTVVFAATGTGNSWSPPSAVTNANGVATSLLASTVAEAKTLGATAAGIAVAQVPSVTFAAPVPSASASSLVATPGTLLANGATTATVASTVRDGDGVPIPGVTVTFAATGTGNSWSPTSAVTNANGVATSVLASTVAEAKTLGATAGGVVVDQTQAVTFTAPAPSAATSSLAASPASVLANGASGTTATATIRDADGVPMSGVTVAFAASGTGNSWSPASVVTNASGVATSGLRSTAAGSKTLSVSAAGVAVAQVQAVTFTPPVPSASASSLAASPASVEANGVATMTVTATVRDADGVAMSGVTVVFAATGSGNSWTPASAATNGSGVATAALSSTVIGARTLSVAAGGVAVAQTRAVTFVPPYTSDSFVSEIGNWYYRDVPAWIEIYNGTAAAVDLAGYTLRAGAVDPTTGATVASSTFPLPSLTIPANAYAVVAGETSGVDYDGGLLVHVADGSGRVPYWFGSGYVELLKAGATVDFVRIGTDATAPTTAGSWTGAGAAAFPTGLDTYAYVLARRPAWVQTRTAADWAQVQFPTPGGPNDVAPGAVSSDADGVPDSAKVQGGTYAGMDLYALGARPGHRDVFVEIDGMASTDAGVLPRRESLDMVVAKFQQHGLYLHLDAGSRFDAIVNPAHYNLGQPDWNVPFSTCVNFPGGSLPCGDVYAYKARHMDLARRAIFHYALFGSSQLVSGAGGSSGRADIVGSNLIVTMGNWGFLTTPVSELNQLVNMQASTFMHEFGHNLGLRHGGDENLNYKPNYLSIMNYLHQLVGLPNPAAATAGDRYSNDVFGTPPACSLDASPCGSPAAFRMDYSSGSGAQLNELAVSETAGLGRGGHWVDYDGSGTQNDGYSRNLIPSWGTHTLGNLHDHDDWTNLQLPFQPYLSWVLGGASRVAVQRRLTPVTPFNDHLREVSQEDAPPARFFEQLRMSQPAR